MTAWRPTSSSCAPRSADGDGLRLPEGELAAVRLCHHAAPPGRPLAWLEQHRGAKPLRLLGRAPDLRHRYVGQPARPLDPALHDAAAQASAEVEGDVAAPAGLDALG